jgi:hypothetical protein
VSAWSFREKPCTSKRPSIKMDATTDIMDVITQKIAKAFLSHTI